MSYAVTFETLEANWRKPGYYSSYNKTIYALADPRTLLVRYVGATTYTAKRRVREHRANPKSPACAWLRELRSLGLEPHIILLSRNANCRHENRWILALRQAGHPLLNSNTPIERGHCGHRTPRCQRAANQDVLDCSVEELFELDEEAA